MSSNEVQTDTKSPLDETGLSLAWLRKQFGWMKQFDDIRIPADGGWSPDRHVHLKWHDDTAVGDLYIIVGGNGGFPTVYVSTVGQVRGLMKLYGVVEKT